MFQAPKGRFQLESKLELPLFSGFTVAPFNLLCRMGHVTWHSPDLSIFHVLFVTEKCEIHTQMPPGPSDQPTFAFERRWMIPGTVIAIFS